MIFLSFRKFLRAGAETLSNPWGGNSAQSQEEVVEEGGEEEEKEKISVEPAWQTGNITMGEKEISYHTTATF